MLLMFVTDTPSVFNDISFRKKIILERCISVFSIKNYKLQKN